MKTQRVAVPIDGRLAVTRRDVSKVAGRDQGSGPGRMGDRDCVFIDSFPGMEEQACGACGEIHTVRDHRGAMAKVYLCDHHLQLVHDPRSPRWLIDTLSEPHHTPLVRLADVPDLGTADDPREAMRVALASLGESIATEMAEGAALD